MSWANELFTWGVIIALGWAAWKYKVKPSLDAKKTEQKVKPVTKVTEASFKELP